VSGAGARGERGVDARHDAALQRRPARISRGIAANGNERVAHLGRRNGSIQRLGVHLVTLAQRQAIDFVIPINCAGPGAAQLQPPMLPVITIAGQIAGVGGGDVSADGGDFHVQVAAVGGESGSCGLQPP
jgi:hypothetical protein